MMLGGMRFSCILRTMLFEMVSKRSMAFEYGWVQVIWLYYYYNQYYYHFASVGSNPTISLIADKGFYCGQGIDDNHKDGF